MQDSLSHQVGQSALPVRTSRRTIVSWTLKLAGGAAFAAAVPGSEWVRVAAAQDDEIILTASASEVGARPGGAYANGAAARAIADYEGGVSTQGGSDAGSGAGPGDSSGAGPGGQSGTGGSGGGGGTGAGPGDSSGAGPGGGGGGGGTGGGGGSGAGPGNSDGSGAGDQSGGGGY